MAAGGESDRPQSAGCGPMRRPHRPPAGRGVGVREYELVTIWNTDLGEDGVGSAIERLNTAVASRGGEVTDTNVWGRRRLAYYIEGHGEGVYCVMQLKLDPRRAAELEGQLRLNENLLRHLMVRKDE